MVLKFTQSVKRFVETNLLWEMKHVMMELTKTIKVVLTDANLVRILYGNVLIQEIQALAIQFVGMVFKLKMKFVTLEAKKGVLIVSKFLMAGFVLKEIQQNQAFVVKD